MAHLHSVSSLRPALQHSRVLCMDPQCSCRIGTWSAWRPYGIYLCSAGFAWLLRLRRTPAFSKAGRVYDGQLPNPRPVSTHNLPQQTCAIEQRSQGQETEDGQPIPREQHQVRYARAWHARNCTPSAVVSGFPSKPRFGIKSRKVCCRQVWGVNQKVCSGGESGETVLHQARPPPSPLKLAGSGLHLSVAVLSVTSLRVLTRA